MMKTIEIKGKQYVEVNERIKYFRENFKSHKIQTEIISLDTGVVVMKASILDEENNVIATGHAYEKEDSSFINKTSYIENCETSAVGRALGMLGIGIDTSIASAEEVENAILNQENKPVKKEQTTEKVKCSKCGKVINSRMAQAFNGMCADCYKESKGK